MAKECGSSSEIVGVVKVKVVRGTNLAVPAAAAMAVVACCAATSSSSSSSSQLHCGTVTSLLSGCAAFVRWRGGGGGAQLPSPGTPCCDGVAGLYAVAADSADNWRAVCRCMARLVRRHSSNASAIALLPGVCGVVSPWTFTAGNTNSNRPYCRRSHVDVVPRRWNPWRRTNSPEKRPKGLLMKGLSTSEAISACSAEVYDRDTFVDDPMGAAFFELRPLVEAAAASRRRRTTSGVHSKEDGAAVVPRSGSSVVWSASEGKAAQGLVLRLAGGVESGEVELQLELEWHGGAAGDTSMIDRLIDRNS
uniref:Bifunctional inhibitor/plant lipid transfer protein/seed storage helical domain-containing protein n=1 Tax=Oryza glumipatula TaxID=40148 RepID=A0A0E0AJC1_9ORYZ